MARSRYEHAPHWHCCPKCKQRYEDACAEPDVNRHCSDCRTGKGWYLLRRNREPRDCCVVHSRLITDKKELARLSLAGDANWWICTGKSGCGRSQGYDPALKIFRAPIPKEQTHDQPADRSA